MNEIFRLDQPLPAPGTTIVLEASAGTGKTYAIAALVTRYVADGLPLDQILAVTFSRRATSELRDGIRTRLIAGKLAIDGWLRDGRLDSSDRVAVLLCDADPAIARLRADRLDEAIGLVDAAPIFTLHTFAARMLDELGVLADHDEATVLETDPCVLVEEVISDSYLGEERWQCLGWQTAHAIGQQAAAHPAERLYPPDDSGAVRVGFATAVREMLDARKRSRRVFGYDDMIMRLSAVLTDPVSGQAAAQLLSERFSVVLVDEFQDTDPAQWAFLEAGFAGRSTLMLIGDPKQAIYRFRGGDIETYHQARGQAERVLRLATNYRSDAEVVRGIENLFGPVDLGSPGVRIELERVATAQQQPRIRREGSLEPAEVVRVRAIDPGQPIKTFPARELIAADLLGQVGQLLDGSHQLREPGGRWRPVRSDDIAVLVSTNKVGRLIHARLTAGGYSAVFTGERSVFTSQAAADWLIVLQTLENPDRWHQRRAMLTSLIGWTSADIASASDDDLVEMSALLTRCARRLTDQGVAAVFETLVAERDLYARLLRSPGGEELTSDLRHITELLNQAQSDQRLTSSALTEFLRRSIEQADTMDEDERARRLPTDRPAIRVMTVHKAKGLQFPIVLLPQAADKYTAQVDDRDEPVVGHQDGERVLDVDSPRGRAGRIEGYQAEDLAESLRAFYVACTRAQSLLICWWAPTQNAVCSPLHRLLMNDRWHAAPRSEVPVEPASELRRPPGVSVTVVDPEQIAKRAGVAPRDTSFAGLLEARRFADHIDRAWTRTSYTGLTTGIHEVGPLPGSVAGFDEVDVAGDDDLEVSEPSAVVEQDQQALSALAELPGGTQFGSLVHAVLEDVDPASAQLEADLGASVRRLAVRYPLTGLDVSALTTGLAQLVSTPLGKLTGDRTLRDLGAARRLAELDFELPLGGPVGRRSQVADLARCFETMLEPGDPLQRYGALLSESAAAGTTLAGFLTGSIDVVLQVPGDPDRYVILDYKTNRLARFGPDAMADAMCQAHYPLQALLYAVALHRYLGWRLPGYDPRVHLGGIGYLFVRGMSGAGNPMLGTMPSGVFTWLPPAEMIVAASTVLAGGER